MRFGEYWSTEKSDRRSTSSGRRTKRSIRSAVPSLDPDEARFFLSLGLGKPAVFRAAADARRHGSTIEQELISSGMLDAATFYEAVAEILGLPYLHAINPDNVFLTEHIDTQLIKGPMLRLSRPANHAMLVIAPEVRTLATLRERLATAPGMRAGLAISSPAAIRAAIWSANRQQRVERAVSRLFSDTADLSARVVMTGRQGFALGLSAALLPMLILAFPLETLFVTHIGLSTIYLMATGFRAAALRLGQRTTMTTPGIADQQKPEAPLPIYTVLVAVYREEQMVPQMIKALDRLDWPKSRLDIKIVCEADDRPTVEAAKAHATGSHYEVLEVPDFGPRTKPKALLYAMAGVRGDYAVVYDAEDRPDPGQLREAHARFEAGPPELGCLQAPLNIANAAESPIAAIFALEYAGQFRSLLPLLGRLGLPMPLGGSSNHFRTNVLAGVLAWDPFNVTEDADLGIRLHRLGYRCDVLARPTLEDAPTTWPIWLKQRSRWFKGWLQTILVHFRAPRRLYREIGWRGMAAILLTTGGMLFSALAHPLLAVFIVRSAWLFGTGQWMAIGLWEQALFVVDIGNILGSYSLFAILGRKPMSPQERRALGNCWAGVPFYWIMLSRGAWHAVAELYRQPFLWHKTPHAPAAGSEQPGHVGEEQTVQSQNHDSADNAQHPHRQTVHVFAHDGAL